MNDKIWKLHKGGSPLIAAAIHDGHQVREEVAERLSIHEADRLREEDPFTGHWTSVAPTRITALRSRFEVDLNRPREKCVYVAPEDAWGLHLWKTKPSPEIVARSLAGYDDFYSEVRRLFAESERRFGRFVVFDLHSYNYLREGPNGPAADPAFNPEVNIGTGTLDRKRWTPIITRFMSDLRAVDFLGRSLDVRENVKFKGGHFAHWTHKTFPGSACVLSIEFKKFFMNEWTGEPDRAQLEAIQHALHATVPGVFEALQKYRY